MEYELQARLLRNYLKNGLIFYHYLNAFDSYTQTLAFFYIEIEKSKYSNTQSQRK